MRKRIIILNIASIIIIIYTLTLQKKINEWNTYAIPSVCSLSSYYKALNLNDISYINIGNTLDNNKRNVLIKTKNKDQSIIDNKSIILIIFTNVEQRYLIDHLNTYISEAISHNIRKDNIYLFITSTVKNKNLSTIAMILERIYNININIENIDEFITPPPTPFNIIAIISEDYEIMYLSQLMTPCKLSYYLKLYNEK